MIMFPDRLTDVRRAIEEGRDVDYGRVLKLQALDVAIAGRAFVEDQQKLQEEYDGQLQQLIAGRIAAD